MFGLLGCLLGLTGWKIGTDIIDNDKKKVAEKKYGVYNDNCKNNRAEQLTVFMQYCTQPTVKEADYMTRKELYELAKKELKRRGYDWNSDWDKEMGSTFVPDDKMAYGRERVIVGQYFKKMKQKSGSKEGYAPLIQDTILGLFFDNLYFRSSLSFGFAIGGYGFCKTVFCENALNDIKPMKIEETTVFTNEYYFAPLFWDKPLKQCYELLILAFNSLYDYKNGIIDKSTMTKEESSLLDFLLGIIKMTDETSPFFDDNPIDKNGFPLKWYRDETVEKKVNSISKLYIPFIKEFKKIDSDRERERDKLTRDIWIQTLRERNVPIDDWATFELDLYRLSGNSEYTRIFYNQGGVYETYKYAADEASCCYPNTCTDYKIFD